MIYLHLHCLLYLIFQIFRIHKLYMSTNTPELKYSNSADKTLLPNKSIFPPSVSQILCAPILSGYLQYKVLDLFSGHGDWIGLIHFSQSQDSSDARLHYPQGAFWRQQMLDYFDVIPPLGGHERKYFGRKNTFPIDLILQVTR